MKTRAVLTAAVLISLFVSAARAEPVRLERKHLEGTRTTRNTVRSEQTLNIAGQNTQTSAEAVTTLRADIGKRDNDGKLRIAETIENLTLKLRLPGGLSLDVDTRNPEAMPDRPELANIARLYHTLAGAKYTYVLDKDNRTVAVEGVEELRAKLPPEQAALIQDNLSEEILLQEANQERGRIPDQPVKTGDRWQRQEVQPLGAGQRLHINAYYEYQGTVEKNEKRLDKIAVFYDQPRYEVRPNAMLPLEAKHSDLKVTESSGTLLFDRERGEVIHSTRLMRIKGNITFSVNGMELPSTLDLTLNIEDQVEHPMGK